MATFKDWGVKIRQYPDKNYKAIWSDLKIVRLGSGVAKELDPDRSEFYDVGIGTKCNIRCPFCYTNSGSDRENYRDICETWSSWMSTFPDDKVEGNIRWTHKPFQIALGSTGEPTIHPDFIRFLKVVYESGVVPNYTTNGVILSESEELLKATGDYCGAVAVSLGNKEVRHRAYRAIDRLLSLGDNIKTTIHHLIENKEDVDEFIKVALSYGAKIHYHVLLPLMRHGRSETGFNDSRIFDYLVDRINREGILNIAFGANFVKYLENTDKIRTWLYPPESLSKNIILKPGQVIITPSSFNLKPSKIIDLYGDT